MRSAAAWLCLACLLAAGCKSSPRGSDARGPAPDYASVASAYNARVAPLERLWSTTTVRVWFPNREGEEEQAQVEGHLQYLSPWRFSLTFEKLGEVYAALGSNEQKYWWIEMNQNDRRAQVGEHAQVNPQRIARLGLPVHPLDLVESLGITPLPAARGAEDVRWSDDAKSLIVTVPGRMGSRRLWIDPDTHEPSRVDVLGRDGAAAVSAELTKYEPVEMPPGAASVPRIATRVLATAQKEKLRVRLTLYTPLVSSAKPKAAAFDLEFLIKAYRINNVVVLDEPVPAAAPGG